MLGPFVRSLELENVMQNLWIRIDLKRELEAFLEHIGLVVGARYCKQNHQTLEVDGAGQVSKLMPFGLFVDIGASEIQVWLG